MIPGQAAAHDGALRLNSTVTGWVEYGTATFAESWLIACDASSVTHLGPDTTIQHVAVAGAVVDEAGAWWAWRATVPVRHCGLVVHWAECLTLLLVLRRARPDALLLSDHAAAICRAQDGLRGGRQRRLHSWQKVESAFGRLPLVPPAADVRVQYYAGHELHRRAHRISNAIRRGNSGTAGFSLESRCTALAAGWPGAGGLRKYLIPDLPAPAGDGPGPATQPQAPGGES